MDAKDQFSKISKQYDSQRRTFIPRFDEFYGAADPFFESLPQEPKAVDIGAGTGIFAAKLLAKRPLAKITLFDISPEMLEVAKKRFCGFERIDFKMASFKDFEGIEKYDAVISALAIHHVSDDEKISLYKRIYKSLKPNGIFVNAEQILGATPNDVKRNAAAREIIVKENLTGDDAKIARARLKLDRCATLDSQLGWLSDIGFKRPRALFQHLDFAVIAAEK